MTGWYDAKRGPAIRQRMRDFYRRALPVACGTYVADYDPTCEDANVSYIPVDIMLKVKLM